MYYVDSKIYIIRWINLKIEYENINMNMSHIINIPYRLICLFRMYVCECNCILFMTEF